MAIRFEIVVRNFRRLPVFLETFDQIRGFRPEKDRLTVISSSAGAEERALLDQFAAKRGIRTRYLPHPNIGRGEVGLASYFAGDLGSPEENLSARFIFTMQDHYLATEWQESIFDETAPAELVGQVKGDVIPDDAVIDLDEMERLADLHDVEVFFCDRGPILVEWRRQRFVMVNGSNFAVSTAVVVEPSVQAATRQLHDSWRDGGDNSYHWSGYAEHVWGRIFFQEGRVAYDLASNRLHTDWSDIGFSQPNRFTGGDVNKVLAEYDPGPLRVYWRTRRRIKHHQVNKSRVRSKLGALRLSRRRGAPSA